jgi:hypothetical protein
MKILGTTIFSLALGATAWLSAGWWRVVEFPPLPQHVAPLYDYAVEQSPVISGGEFYVALLPDERADVYTLHRVRLASFDPIPLKARDPIQPMRQTAMRALEYVVQGQTIRITPLKWEEVPIDDRTPAHLPKHHHKWRLVVQAHECRWDAKTPGDKLPPEQTDVAAWLIEKANQVATDDVAETLLRAGWGRLRADWKDEVEGQYARAQVDAQSARRGVWFFDALDVWPLSKPPRPASSRTPQPIPTRGN